MPEIIQSLKFNVLWHTANVNLYKAISKLSAIEASLTHIPHNSAPENLMLSMLHNIGQTASIAAPSSSER